MARLSKKVTVLLGVSMLLVILACIVTVLFKGTFFRNNNLSALALTELDQKTYENWVTYSNEKLAFSIKIPPEWTIDEERNSENEPTGLITFQPSESASPSAISQIRVNLRQPKEFMTNQEEFNKYKDASYTGQVGDYKKIATLQSPSGDALFFNNSTSQDTLELLTWIRNNTNTIFIETISDVNKEEESVLFHRYLLQTAIF